MRLAATLLLTTAILAGCATPDGPRESDDGHGHAEMGADSFRMQLSGMPSGPMAPGARFNVTVQATHGMGHEGMGAMASDHIGAHFWNTTMMDPTAGIGDSTACVHRSGEMPGQFTAVCTAPMQAGTYHIRAHSRMMDGGQMHNYWSDEQSFTVA